MNNLDITNEKIRKDLTFNYNGKEYLYSYGKDTLTNNNFTLLYENNKSKDEILRIYDNNLTINEKYLDENVINKDFFEILKQNNLLDKTEKLQNEYNISMRTANSIIKTVQGKINSIKELKKTEIKQKKYRLEKISEELEKLIPILLDLKLKAEKNDIKDLSKEIVILSDEYPYGDVHEVNFIYNHNEYCYVSGENKETITIEFTGHNDLVFEKKKNIVGSGVDVIHYNNKLFDEDFFKALKNNDITSNLFGDKDYKQFCENSIDVANDKESVDLER